jgi:hypothetical protein
MMNEATLTLGPCRASGRSELEPRMWMGTMEMLDVYEDSSESKSERLPNALEKLWYIRCVPRRSRMFRSQASSLLRRRVPNITFLVNRVRMIITNLLLYHPSAIEISI